MERLIRCIIYIAVSLILLTAADWQPKSSNMGLGQGTGMSGGNAQTNINQAMAAAKASGMKLKK